MFLFAGTMSEEAFVSTLLKKRPLYQRAWFLAIASIGVISVAFVVVGGLLFMRPVKNEGSGMSPTINDGDRIFFSRTAGKIERGEIVLFRYPNDPRKSFIKRIVALPGDTIRIDDSGGLYINDNLTAEPYLSADRHRTPRSLPLQTLKENEYFVMGDNRDASNDSRSWGPVPRGLIYGKFLWRYW